jgi:hypothetical protein
VGLPLKLAAAASVASAGTGVAGYGGADEVLPAPRVDPFPQGLFRFSPEQREWCTDDRDRGRRSRTTDRFADEAARVANLTPLAGPHRLQL